LSISARPGRDRDSSSRYEEKLLRLLLLAVPIFGSVEFDGIDDNTNCGSAVKDEDQRLPGP
jgi:hypothetical protein